jgi:predicted acylesterase/phospholipase RssA
MAKKALVLSGGGMFGAWQAGAWRVLAKRFQPDLIVGASVGSLNGYAIASGASPDELCDRWTRPGALALNRLPQLIADLMSRPLQFDYAVVLTDMIRMKPVTITGAEVTAAHLEASCAVPVAKLPVRIGGRWYVDGGLLNPLPVFAAVELGATEILALHVLPRLPGIVLPILAVPFIAVFGHKPPLPDGVRLVTIIAPERLGTWMEAIRWDEQNSRRWLAEGAQAAEENISALDCFGG